LKTEVHPCQEESESQVSQSESYDEEEGEWEQEEISDESDISDHFEKRKKSGAASR
jgi:hypothetical protein